MDHGVAANIADRVAMYEADVEKHEENPKRDLPKPDL
jgi:hypothetical protein